VGPEKSYRLGWTRQCTEFQSVSGLWDRRNRSCSPAAAAKHRFNPSPVCGTGEIPPGPSVRDDFLFQSVSGLWDRRNSIQTSIQHVSPVSIRLRSVGPEKSAGRRVGADQAGFNPSPVCGTGEIWSGRSARPAGSGFNPSPVCGTGEMWPTRSSRPRLWFQSVSGLWDRRNITTRNIQAILYLFQSVSGLWDRRNARFARRDRRRFGFNPSPVCGTGEMLHKEEEGYIELFQSVSGLWDRRNPGCRRRRCPAWVSIRLRSVGPEKSGGRQPKLHRRGFNPSPVCGTGEIFRQVKDER